MATVTRKPHHAPADAQAREAAIAAVIQKGMARPEDPPPTAEDTLRQVVLFLPASLLADVDVLVQKVRPRTSRRAWLVEAIHEKVEREKDIV
jgi:hypothetical protein